MLAFLVHAYINLHVCSNERFITSEQNFCGVEMRGKSDAISSSLSILHSGRTSWTTAVVAARIELFYRCTVCCKRA